MIHAPRETHIYLIVFLDCVTENVYLLCIDKNIILHIKIFILAHTLAML